jgi:hypothetical protein
VRRLVVLVAIIVSLAACGSTAVAQTPIVFGVTGGNIVPYRVSIQPDGSVRAGGTHANPRRRISRARVRVLRLRIERADLASRSCPGVLPDIAGRYIRYGGRTVTVHGTCEPGFERVWNDLTRAVGRPIG